MTTKKKANKKKVEPEPNIPNRILLVLMRNVENELEKERLKKSRRRKHDRRKE